MNRASRKETLAVARRRRKTTAKRRKKKSNDTNSETLLIVVAIFILISICMQIVKWATTHPYIFTLITGGILALIALFFSNRRKGEKVSISSNSRPPTSPSQSTNLSDSNVDPEFENAFLKSKISESGKPSKWSLELIKSLDWKLFEDLCAGYFQAKGQKAKVTNLGADGGIDILLYGENNPEKILGVVQCKAWSKKPVGVREVRELLGIMTDVGCILGVYITTSGYTTDAKTFAEGKHINLMDALKLLNLIQKLSLEAQTNLLKQITVGDYTTPSCPSCGIKLTVRTFQKGTKAGKEFWGCHNFPRCRYKLYKSNLQPHWSD